MQAHLRIDRRSPYGSLQDAPMILVSSHEDVLLDETVAQRRGISSCAARGCRVVSLRLYGCGDRIGAYGQGQGKWRFN